MPGVIGVVLTLTGSLISSVTVIREKDVGTLEQLLMTPAAAWEILLAKVVPLFLLLMGDVLIASGMGRFIFHLPFRGNFGLFLALSGLYVFVSIGLGILLATISRTQQQVVLTSFSSMYLLSSFLERSHRLRVTHLFFNSFLGSIL